MTTELNKYSSTALSRASRKKSNSERGKEFRAKRRKYEMELVSRVFALRKEVDDLQTSIETRLDASNVEIASEKEECIANGQKVPGIVPERYTPPAQRK